GQACPMLVEVLGQALRDAIASAFGSNHAGIDPLVRRSARGLPSALHGRADMQADVAPTLAKTLGLDGRAVAEAIVAPLPACDAIERVTIGGAGFLELAVSDAWLASWMDRARVDAHLGVPLA